MDHGLLPQLVGRPGHAAAVVTVGGGKEGRLAELPLERLAGQVVVGHFADVPVHLLGDIPGHGKGASQHLEGVEPEAEGLILYIQPAQTQVFRHTVQASQWRNGILGKAVVKKAGLGHIVQRHNLKLTVLTCRHMIHGPFDLFSHAASPYKIF